MKNTSPQNLVCVGVVLGSWRDHNCISLAQAGPHVQSLDLGLRKDSIFSLLLITFIRSISFFLRVESRKKIMEVDSS